MRGWRGILGDQQGVALVLALMVLLTLTGLALAFLSVSAFEPQISRNLADTSRARYLAEAGIEVGFNQVIATTNWNTLLTGATSGSPWVAMLSNVTLPGLSSAEGTFTVTVRNDAQAGDTAITGEATIDGAWATDGNGVLIMRATGTYRNVSRTLEVVARRLALPPFPGAVNIPGMQSDTYLNNNTPKWTIDGRDYRCSSNCDDAANWTPVDDEEAPKYGIAVQPGVQSNNGNTYEYNVEQAANTSTKRNNIKGKDQGGDDDLATGTSTIAPDASLNPTVMANFLGKLAAYSGTQVLQSTIACPMVLSGGNRSDDPTQLTSTPTLTNGCGLNQTLDLGSPSNPKLVYFRGDWDPSSSFTGLQIDGNSGIKGAGILVVEDGDFKNYGAIQWDGIVIVTGAFVSAAFMANSKTKIRGTLTALESQPGEASGYFDFYMHSGLSNLSILFSQQNLNLVQNMRALHSLTNWREI